MGAPLRAAPAVKDAHKEDPHQPPPPGPQADRSKMAEAVRDALAHRTAQRQEKRAVKASTSDRDASLLVPRVANMFREALDFKGEAVVPFQAQLADLEKATLDYFDDLLPLLRAPLPRVWDAVEESGLAEPIRATVSHNHPNVAGGVMRDSAMRASYQEYEARLQLKVRRPLSEWVQALETVRDRLPEMERLRRQLETRVTKLKRQESKAERETRRRLGVQRGVRGVVVQGPGPRPIKGVRGLLYRCTHPRADEGQGIAPVGDLEMSELMGGATGAGGGAGYTRGVGRNGGGGGEAGEQFTAGGTTPRSTGTRAVAGTTGGGGGPAQAGFNDEMTREFRREDRDIKIKDSQRKFEAAQQAYTQDEQLLFEHLSGLCRDASWTKSYVASALLMTKELMQEAVYNLGDTLQPPPGFSLKPGVQPAVAGSAAARAAEPAGEAAEAEEVPTPGTFAPSEFNPPLVSGQLGSNMGYNASLPDFATRARARATLDDLRSAATRRLHAHRATATPLELHASPEARPGERVAPARRGATTMPLAALPQRVMTPGAGTAPATPLASPAHLGTVA